MAFKSAASLLSPAWVTMRSGSPSNDVWMGLLAVAIYSGSLNLSFSGSLSPRALREKSVMKGSKDSVLLRSAAEMSVGELMT
jgi:hypothetical protein